MVPRRGGRLFLSLSVEEEPADGGAYARKLDGPWTLETVYDRLTPHPAQSAAAAPPPALSVIRLFSRVGQQQMVAIGRALMSEPPRARLATRSSLGPRAGDHQGHLRRDARASRRAAPSVIVVEQDIGQALRVSDRVYCFMEGRVTPHGPPGRPLPPRPSTTPISGARTHDLGRDHHPGRAARRALRALSPRGSRSSSASCASSTWRTETSSCSPPS